MNIKNRLITIGIKNFTDNRGTILDFGNGVQIIDSYARASRASHWHRSSGHDCYLTKGSLNYYERPVGSKDKPTKVHIVAPARFSTGPMVEHTMVFVENSTFVCVRTGGSYTPEEYEADIVRFDHNLEEVFNAHSFWEESNE
jgi:hypothetical protein